MIKKHAAFTLIELMVVVAIIAILATMGVANFSTAILKARNSVRMNDVLAISKSLETCYNIMEAHYTYDNIGFGSVAPAAGGTPSVSGPFKAQGTSPGDNMNRCLDQDIIPSMASNPYGARFSIPDPNSSAQKYVVCAQLEKVAGWSSLGNWKGGGTITSDGTNIPAYEDYAGVSNACEEDQSEPCFFCVAAQQ